MAGERELNRGKLKELMLLLAARSADDPRMSRVKWNKLLYRADFEAYRTLGHSMTGVTYIKGEHGPMVENLPIYEEELGKAGRLTWRTDRSGKHPQKIPIATGDPADLQQFTQEELAIIDRALEELREYGGWAASEWSHEESAGWNLVDDNQPIPYETAYISARVPTRAMYEHAQRLAKERGWASVHP